MSKLSRSELQSVLEGRTISKIDASANVIIIEFTDGYSIMLEINPLELIHGISIYGKEVS